MSQSLPDRVDAALDHAAALDRYLRRIHTDDHTEPHSDRQSTGQLKRLDLGRTAQIIYGRVVDTISYCHWYKVQPEGVKTTIPCSMLSGTALTPFGVREHNLLHPNAGVYVLLHPSSPYGVIIGVEPKHQCDGTKSLSDYISLASAHSIQTEQVHSFPFTLPKHGTIVDWSSGRPADGTCAGEWGMFAESGVAAFLDSAMAFLRADENTGFWAFYRDQLARVSGHNLQIRATGGWEVEATDDQGEFNHYSGFTPYPWEQLGAYAHGTPLHKEQSAAATQVNEPHYSKYEPLLDDQQPFHRTRHYHGYAGQGGTRQVVAPPVGATGVHRYSDPTSELGLFEEHITQTGHLTIRTAKGVRLIKRTLNPVVKNIRRPEDAAGDTEANYKAASQQGAGADHAVTADVETAGEDAHMNQLLGALDAHTYSVNWEGVIGFKYHTKDCHLPEESALKTAFGVSNIAEIPFANLTDGHFLAPPTPARIKVDHRYQEVKYYPSYSYIDLADDGSIEISDGYGSGFRMSGGHIYVAPAGDLVLQPGRNLVVMAGRDASIRANNHLELSTTKQDVRIHSGKNMELAAEDGMLIESKSTETGWDGWRNKVGEAVVQHGIHFKAANSSICTWGDLVYLRAGVAGAGNGLYIDAGQGEGNIFVNCAAMQTWAQTTVSHYLGGSDSVEAVYNLTPSGASIGGSVTLDGSITASGTILAKGWIMSSEGHVSSALADSYEGQVSVLRDQNLSEAQRHVEEGSQAHDIAKTTASSAYDTLWTSALYADNGCGDVQTIEDVGFSFRTGEQYKTSNFRLYEARWQQLARIWGSGTVFWQERPVQKSGEATYPFPGKEKLIEDSAFYTQDLNLFDLSAGTAKDRTDEGYTDPHYVTPTPTLLNEAYRVIE